MINVFVGVFNLVPLLPLDGGHVVIGTYERLRSRGGRRYHADVAKALPLAYLVMIVLLSVGLVAVYLDIADPINL
jgi:membrane-associated protease RseP (regulator of RpoE activity)